MERKEERFVKSRDSVYMVATITTALGFLNALSNGKGFPGALSRASHSAAMVGLRYYLDRMKDQRRACRIWGYGVALITVACMQIMTVLQVHGHIFRDISVAGAVGTSILAGLSSLYMRHVAVSAGPRFVCIASVGMTSAITGAMGGHFSELGHPHEAVLISSCLLLGELVGHTVEVGWHASGAGASSSKTASGIILNEEVFDRIPAATAEQTLQQQLDEHRRRIPERPERAGDAGGHEEDAFDVVGLIGRGGSSDVFLVSKRDGLFAMKRVAKARLKPFQLRLVREEMEILRQVHHPFIIPLHSTIEMERYIYITLQYARGGDLSAWVDRITPDRTRVIIAEVLLALGHIHEVKVIYRDVKLENTLVGVDGHILLSDFGVSKRLDVEEVPPAGADAGVSSDVDAGGPRTKLSPPTNRTATLIGTPNYMSPEIWRGDAHGYSYEVDWWAMAVMLHEMLTGDSIGVCRDQQPEILVAQIDEPQAIDLLTSMLRWDLTSRLGFDDQLGEAIQAHPYFAEHIDFGALLRKEIRGPLLVEDDALPERIGAPASGVEGTAASSSFKHYLHDKRPASLAKRRGILTT